MALPGVRANVFNENYLNESEQDANSVLTELDKGLRASKIGVQCEAIVRFPRLFEKYPFPILINSSFLKLAEFFLNGSNLLRYWVLRVCQQSENHLDKILNIEAFVKRIFMVIYSNDPVARGMTLRTLGAVSRVIAEKQQVHHAIRRALDSHDSVEVEAAIYASAQFAAQSKSFAISMCAKISDMIESLLIPVPMKLHLIPVLRHMHHDSNTASLVRDLCLNLLPKYPAESFVVSIIDTLTQLTARTLCGVTEHIELLLSFLDDSRDAVRSQSLRSLRLLTDEECVHAWSKKAIEDVISKAKNCEDPQEQYYFLILIQKLTKSPLTCYVLLTEQKVKMHELCLECMSSCDLKLSTQALTILTGLVTYGGTKKPDVSEFMNIINMQIEGLLFLLVFEDEYYMLTQKTLDCGIRTAMVDSEFAENFICLVANLLDEDMDCPLPNMILLCKTLGKMGEHFQLRNFESKRQKLLQEEEPEDEIMEEEEMEESSVIKIEADDAEGADNAGEAVVPSSMEVPVIVSVSTPTEIPPTVVGSVPKAMPEPEVFQDVTPVPIGVALPEALTGEPLEELQEVTPAELSEAVPTTLPEAVPEELQTSLQAAAPPVSLPEVIPVELPEVFPEAEQAEPPGALSEIESVYAPAILAEDSEALPEEVKLEPPNPSPELLPEALPEAEQVTTPLSSPKAVALTSPLSDPLSPPRIEGAAPLGTPQETVVVAPEAVKMEEEENPICERLGMLLDRLNVLLEGENVEGRLQVVEILTGVILQSNIGYCLPSELVEFFDKCCKKTNCWTMYRLARSCSRYGHHYLAAMVYSKIYKAAHLDRLHFFLVGMAQISEAESILNFGVELELIENNYKVFEDHLGSMKSETEEIKKMKILDRLQSAINLYWQANTNFRACSSSSHGLSFQLEYIKLRARFLQTLHTAVTVKHAQVIVPPPAIASSLAQASRDHLQKYGYVTNQLRKLVKAMKGCQEEFSRLYKSAFDADPLTLEMIETIEYQCALFAHTVETICYTTPPEPPIFQPKGSCPENSNLVTCCHRMEALIRNLPDETGTAKSISNRHLDIVIAMTDLILKTPHCLPRYFFQMQQSTHIKLSISPQPRAAGEPVIVQAGSNLVIKVEGVVQHFGRKRALFRHIESVQITLNATLVVPRTATEIQKTESIVLSQTVKPQRDFLSCNFLLTMTGGGQWQVSLETCVIDENGFLWTTGPKSSMIVRMLDDTTKPTTGAQTQTGQTRRF